MKYIKWIAAIIVGATAGFAYWHFVGCTSGCAITSSPVNSSLYGALMGVLLMNTFSKSRKNKSTGQSKIQHDGNDLV